MARHLALILHLFFASGIGCMAASPGETLAPSQWAELSLGKPLVFHQEIPGKPWPEMTIWQLVDYPPEAVAGVFWDTELDPAYLPGCLDARIIARPSPSVQKARFRLKMPLFLPDEVYVSDIQLVPQPPGSYKITWKVTESVYAKTCIGEIRIEPHGGQTLIRYRNFMDPRSRIAGLLKRPGMDRVVESYHALVAQTAKVVAGSPSLLEQQRKALRLASGK